MRMIIKMLLVVILGVGGAWAAPARGGVMTFRQANGETFQGLLRGNAAFHWIESNGEIVLYNPDDGNYYKAEVVNNRLEMSGEKAVSIKHAQSRTLGSGEAHHSVSSVTKKSLERLYREAQKGHRPR